MTNKAVQINENDPSRWDDKFDKIIKWYNDDRDDDDPKKTKLPADLEDQVKRWSWLYSMVCIPKNRYKTDAQLIKLVQTEYPDLSERTARRTLRDMRRFFGVIEKPELAFEKVMLIASIKDTLKKAKVRKDYKAAATSEKNLIAVLGADQALEAAENKTIINIIAFNPEQLGGQAIDPEQLEEMIQKMLSSDKKKAEKPFDDYTDVTGQQE